MNVSGAFRVVPKLDFKTLNENKSGYVFNQGHNDGYKGDYEHVAPYFAFYKAIIERADNKQENDARSVKRKARTDEKAGVYPFFMRESAEKEFYNPSARAADYKEKT